jgi:hydroxymethylpyrimidine pyrophosphatase-like HAD family hydrolase
MTTPLSQAPLDQLARVRLLATDIDGTMTRHGKIPPDVLEAIVRLHAAGVEVLPVTGRSAGEALGLARYLPTVTRAIAENGAVFVTPDAPHRYAFGEPRRELLRRVATRISATNPLEPAPCSPFRVADVAFERAGRKEPELLALKSRAEAEGVHLVWSSVHVHLSSHRPDKGAGLLSFLGENGVDASEVAVVGDAPNDAGFWLPRRFGVQVGTAEVTRQAGAIEHMPAWLVGHAADGWLELADAIVRARG